jgi:hypothetical protein
LRRWLAVCGAAAALLIGGWWLLQGAPGSRGVTPSGPGRRAAQPPVTPGLAPEPALSRNIFEYAEAPAAPVAAAPARVFRPPSPQPSVLLSPPPPPVPEVRLVGVVVRGGQRKAALYVRGEMAVLAAGETAGGYTVLSIDEDDGVRVRGPEGELTLSAPVG